MVSNSRNCIKRADAAEGAALAASHPSARETFAAIAQSWRRLADSYSFVEASEDRVRSAVGAEKFECAVPARAEVGVASPQEGVTSRDHPKCVGCGQSMRLASLQPNTMHGLWTPIARFECDPCGSAVTMPWPRTQRHEL